MTESERQAYRAGLADASRRPVAQWDSARVYCTLIFMGIGFFLMHLMGIF